MSYYFDKETNVESDEIVTKARIKNNVYTFKTDNNVFSKKGFSVFNHDIHTHILFQVSVTAELGDW